MIECSPIVLFEAMASQTPFLVTDVGNTPEIAQWSQSGIVMPTNFTDDGLSHADITASAHLLRKMINDPLLMQKFADNGYRSWKEKFTWNKIAGEYEGLYSHLLHPLTPSNAADH